MNLKSVPGIFLLLVIPLFRQAQVTLEHIYSESAEVADIEGYGLKYFVTNYLNNSVLVYNEDHSYWKTIQLAMPQNQYLYDVAYLSSKLFNRDNLLELLMVSYRYITTSDTKGYYIYETRVVSETGIILADVPGGGYSYAYTNSNNKIKLVVYVYDFSISDYIISTEFFGLPDPVNGFTKDPAKELLPYPNPADNIVNLPYNTDLRKGTSEIIITDISGRDIYKGDATGDGYYENFDSSALPAGTYIYRVKNNGVTIPGKTFVIK